MCLCVPLQLFEGMKAFRGVDNHIRLFRPMLNMARMHRSADRSCLPVSLSASRMPHWQRAHNPNIHFFAAIMKTISLLSC